MHSKESHRLIQAKIKLIVYLKQQIPVYYVKQHNSLNITQIIGLPLSTSVISFGSTHSIITV